MFAKVRGAQMQEVVDVDALEEGKALDEWTLAELH